MDAPSPKLDSAWQPLTPKGIAAFGRASLWRLLLVQLAFALLTALAVINFIRTAWFPVVAQAISRLPEVSEIRYAELRWDAPAPVLLGENRFLSISVDTANEGRARSVSHMALELGRRNIKVVSIFGYATIGYPTTWRISLRYADVFPWWGAWSPALLALAAAISICFLFFFWSLLASFYFIPLKLAAYFSDRELSLGSSWRISGAALMGPSLLLGAAVCLYANGTLDLIQFIIAAGLHVVAGWIFVFLPFVHLPRSEETLTAESNPFAKKK